ncbi:uncharacterized protein [Palaemon carinicauda]|uniref:uncharacterized protein n=1 Tax=Palaemon carinicauda TaxID=392227 RepID=UPI0035B5D5A3
MKTLALGFLASLLLVSYCTGFKSCFARKELKQMAKMRMENPCMAPTDRFVQLEVPDGFDSVTPGTVKVKRCDGYCWKKKTGCLPTKTKMIYFNVEARHMDPRQVAQCVPVGVEEHLECGCDCMTKEDSCSERQEFDVKSCSCMCKEELMEECSADKMWSWGRCQCIRANDRV